MAAPTPRIDLSPLRRADGRLLLVLFLLVDLGLILTHLSSKILGTPSGYVFDLGVDRGYGEFFLAVKLGWTAFACLVLAWRRRRLVFVSLALICLVLVIEDVFMLHERVGWALEDDMARLVPFLGEYGILAIQAGELLWFAGVGVLILALFVVGYLRADQRNRRDALSIALFFGVLAFFAVGVDTLHSFFDMGTTADLVLTTVEDGGEVLSMSPAAALALCLAWQADLVAAEPADRATVDDVAR